ncbi:MAG: endonuclease VII domain-containing protein [Arthrobacter sp.]
MDGNAGNVKRCPACGESKPATPEYFYRDKHRPDGLTPRCKVCFRDTTYGNLKVTAVVVDGKKQCIGCGEWKPLDREHFNVKPEHSTGFHPLCKDCRNARRRATYDPTGTQAWREAQIEADPDWSFNQARRHTYARHGISEEDYTSMLAEQGGVCYICQREETTVHSGGRVKLLAVDHDHQTGAVRGLLCQKCNHALGLFDDDPERLRRAADYIEKGGV